jgi:hypothetical protein
MSDDRNTERRQLRVVKVEGLRDSGWVEVSADDGGNNTVTYTTTADRAPRVGVNVSVYIEVIR